MKKILIIYPHFPPSNLAGVHRPRLFAQHLPAFGWEPVVLTVHERYYEETLDWNLHKLLPEGLRIEKVRAFKISKPRLIGDIGMRGFFQLYRRAKSLIKNESFDFLYIPIPSFYCALLGRWLHGSTGIKYGIDYIDPWVHDFPGSDKVFSRHWLSSRLARLLEPVALKKTSIITGVAEGYYQAVLERNPQLNSQALCGAMPYGGEASDHAELCKLNITPYLFSKNENLQFVYAGAMLPKAYKPLESMFASIVENITLFKNVKFHFIGTGSSVNDPESFTIKPLAEKYGLYETVIHEYPKRIPYLDVLVHLSLADGIFILGSSERHYTPSKTYQGVLSGKPIFAILHQDSTAIDVIEKSRAGLVLGFDGENDIEKIRTHFSTIFEKFKLFVKEYRAENVDTDIFDQYSAKAVTETLAKMLDKVLLYNFK